MKRRTRLARRLLCPLGYHHWFYTADGAPHRPYRFCQRYCGTNTLYLNGLVRNYYDQPLWWDYYSVIVMVVGTALLIPIVMLFFHFLSDWQFGRG